MTGSPLAVTGTQELTRCFTEHRRLTVRQRKRWMEILLSFEMKNSYDVFDEHQRPVLRVEEMGEGFVSLLKRLILGPMRPLEVRVVKSDGAPLLLLTRPFRFIFHRLEVRASTGDLLGVIEREWSWFRRIYRIEVQAQQKTMTIFGPILKPWTFEIQDQGRKVGVIEKRWTGFGKEMFTDADNFGVDLTDVHDPVTRALVFAATVLIDVCHFERAKG